MMADKALATVSGSSFWAHKEARSRPFCCRMVGVQREQESVLRSHSTFVLELRGRAKRSGGVVFFLVGAVTWQWRVLLAKDTPWVGWS